MVFQGIGDLFSGTGGMFRTILYALIILVPTMVIVAMIIVGMRNRAIYRYNVRVFRLRENGKVKESNFVGGYVGRKNSAPFFRIKTGRWPWNIIDLNTTPNPAHMDEEDRFYYLQTDVNTFVQTKRTMNLDGATAVEFAPVESDVKYGAILDINRIRSVLSSEPTWKKLLAYGSLIILAVVFIIAYAMLMDKCG